MADETKSIVVSPLRDEAESSSVEGCPFCLPNWKNLDVVSMPSVNVRIIRPLNPVVDGHVLVINAFHTVNAAARPTVAAELMYHAAEHVKLRRIQANIITSIGGAATQTVEHTHTHVVPRRIGDGLHLPWTGQIIE